MTHIDISSITLIRDTSRDYFKTVVTIESCQKGFLSSQQQIRALLGIVHVPFELDVDGAFVLGTTAE